MKLKRTTYSLLLVICTISATSLVTITTADAQSLTVREIMAEPSIAGMRAEGEKLSPDGSKAVFLWNAEGKMPRDLYLSSTDKADAKVILRVSDLPKPFASPTPESKLTYGLIVKDDFVKERENQLGGFEWSPDSAKLVFSYGGDLFVLTPGAGSNAQHIFKWNEFESLLQRRADLLPEVVRSIGNEGIRENEAVGRIADTRAKLLSLIFESPKGLNGGKSELQTKEILDANLELSSSLRILDTLRENYPILQSSDSYIKAVEELRKSEKQIKEAQSDLDFVNKKLMRYTKTQSPEAGARFLDNDRIIYQQNGNFFVLNTADATTVQLTKESNLTAFIAVGGGIATKDAKLVTYTVSDSSKFKPLFVPNYLDEFTAAPLVRRGWSEQKLYVTATDGSRDTPFEVKLPKQEGVGGFRGIKWAADNRSLIVDRGDKDTKRRQLFYVYNAGSKDEKIILITEETDEKWQAPLSAIFEPNPKDPSELFFASERDGYNHLYLANLETAKPEPNPTGVIRAEGDPGFTGKVEITQITRGNWQVEWAKWDTKTRQIIYLSTEAGTAVRKFSVITANAFKVETFDDTELNDTPGMIESPQLASDSESNVPQLIYGFSRWDRPTELVAKRLCFSCSSSENTTGLIQLTKTTPDAFSKMKWNEPKFIDIPSRDGKVIKAKIYLPAGHNSKKKYPMTIFVHGAGYLQNTINGWNNYYREFMFNQLLTQKGYVVLDIDYRGSAGYGREWRTDVYDFLGGKDFDDHINSIDFMVKNYAVNPAKVGVYGGSYGGFMAGMLVTRAPDKIAAAAALRPVFDWKNYYASSPGYTAQRLGFPDKNPEAYKRSSPITYADKLERPLLILHGMVDDNVHVQDSQQMIEKLIRLGKTQYVEAMLYPAENHGFTRPSSWIDEYERILTFFEKHLK